MIRNFLFHYGVKLIPILNWLKDTWNSSIGRCTYFYDSIVKSFHSDILYFYDKNPTAYIGSYIDIHNKNNGIIVWKYSRSAKKFFQYSCQYKDVKHFPIISASIVLNKENAYVLDEFISDILIERTNADYPSLQQVLEVWTYSTGVILDRTKSYMFVYLDNHLNEYTVNLFTGSLVFPSS